MSTFEEAITEPDISHVGSKIEYCTFLRSITKLKSDDIVSLINDYFYLSINDLLVNGTISYCKFNGAVTGVIIDGTGAISNCSFMGLSKDGNDKLKVIGALSNTDIHDDITPKSAEWVEKVDTEGESDEYIRIIDLPGAFTSFEISSSAVPKLVGRNKKDCYLRSVTKNGTTKKIFIVSLGANINADNAIQGMIVMMSGSYPIPDGWAICDGNNGTPDLRGRFIRMIEEGESTGPVNNSDLETNGTGTRQAYLKKAIKHTHTFNTYNTNLTADLTNFSVDYSGVHSLEVDVTGLSVTVNSTSPSYYAFAKEYGTSIGKFKEDTTDGTMLGKYSASISHSHTANISGVASITGNLPSI
ncbi:MAG: tail fiber protein [Bacilli bacterium]|nr:tail fiber protein [Bacilli bacterium]